jgi:hypothetical protein
LLLRSHEADGKDQSKGSKDSKRSQDGKGGKNGKASKDGQDFRAKARQRPGRSLAEARQREGGKVRL